MSVTGNLNPVYDSGSCTHTNLAAGAASWWQVDLGHAALGYDVISVVTTNREAEGECSVCTSSEKTYLLVADMSGF